MASLLSLPSTIPTKTTVVLHHPYSPFKGNVRNLKANQCSFPSLEIHLKTKVGKPLVILSKASLSPSTSNATPNSRFRLDNLGPQPGSRKKAKRKGRGISAGQGGSCGFGMRGQKSRSGPGVRRGFEGGQMPLYRRIPKLRGIAGGPPLIVVVGASDQLHYIPNGIVVKEMGHREHALSWFGIAMLIHVKGWKRLLIGSIVPFAINMKIWDSLE